MTPGSIKRKHFFFLALLLFELFNCAALFGQCQGFGVTIDGPPIETYCPGTSVTLTADVVGGTPPYGYNWNFGSTDPIQVMPPVGNGTYNVTLTVTDANGCVATATFMVRPVIWNFHVIMLIGPFCEGVGMPISVEGTGIESYLWSTGETTSNIIAYDPGSYTVTVTNNTFGCTNSLEVFPNIIPSPDFEIEGPVSLCQNGFGTLSVTGGTFPFYNWLPGGETTPDVTITEPGLYSVTVTDDNGCTAAEEWDVQPLPSFPPQIDSPALLCPGENGIIEITNPGDYSSISWSNGETGPVITGVPQEFYAVTVTDLNGCSEIAAVSIETYDVIDPIITGEVEICVGQEEVDLSVLPTFENYEWSTGETAGTVSVVDPGTYSVTVTDFLGCTSSGQYSIGSAPFPEPEIPVPAASCPGNPVALSVNGGPFETYEWSDGSMDLETTVSQGGTYAVTVTNDEGCTASDEIEVVFSGGPLANITAAPFNCSSSTTLTASGGHSYEWSTGETTATISVDTSGTFTVIVEDVAGCTDSADVVIDLPNLPVVVISGSTELCNAASGQLSATAGFENYNWSNGENTAEINVSQTGTYSVTITDINGCTATASQTVSESPPPQPEVVGPSGFCEGEIAILGLTQPFSQIIWSNNEATQSISVAQSGTYTVTVTNAAGCTGTDQLTVNSIPSPAVTIAGDTAICNGSTSVFSIPNIYSQINWSTGATTDSISINSSGNYQVTVTDANGCTASAEQVLEISAPPLPVILATADPCGGEVVLDVGSGFSTYLWSNNGTTSFINVTSDDEYSVTVGDAMGCIGTAVESVTVPSPPAIDIAAPAAICEDGVATLVADGGFELYEWSNGETTATITDQPPGSYSVIATDANGCTAVASQTVDTFPSPNAVITGPVSICTGSTAELTVSGNFTQVIWNTGASAPTINVAQADAYSVIVSDANGCTAMAEHELEVGISLSPTINTTSVSCDGWATLDAGGGFSDYIWSNGESTQNINVDNDGIYAVTVNDGTGCTGEAELTVNLPIPPEVEIMGILSICTGSSTLLSVPDNFTQISWSTGETTPVISVSAEGLYAVTITDANSCTAIDSQLLEVTNSLAVNIESDLGDCDGTATLDAGNGYDAYLWSDGSTDPTLVIGNNGPYEVTVTDVNGCTGTGEIEVIIPDLPVVIIAGEPTFCEGSTTVLATADDFEQYLWSTGETTSAILVNQGGSYSVTVVDANGCTAADAWDLEELAIDYTYVQNEACSAQDTGTVELLFTNQFGCDSIVFVNTTLAPSQSMSISLTACPGEFAEYNGNLIAAGATEQFIYSAANGCDSIVSVTAIELPAVSFDFSTNAACWNIENGAIEVFASNGTPPFTFAIDGGNVQSTPVFDNLASGEYNVTVTDTQGCTAGSFVLVETLPATAIQLESTMLTCEEPNVQLVPQVLSGSPVGIQWLWNDGSMEPSLSVGQPGEYSVLADDGCEIHELSTEVSWDPEIGNQNFFYVPNSFSPNQDGINDDFRAYRGENFSILSFELNVFDRWGGMVFTSTDFAQGWNGSQRNSQNNTGVYIWFARAEIELCNGRKVDFFEKGDVAIIR